VLPFDLPPPIPIYAPAPNFTVEQPLLIAKEKEKPGKVTQEEQAFHSSVSNFQQHLAKLPPKHKAEIRKIHTQVTQWADKQRAAGQRADKLSTFVGKVMAYADKHLENIEKADPELKQFKAQHKQFQDLFLAGNKVIEAYLAWVRTDYKPVKKPEPKKV
jgi:hypothetical protein